MVSLRETSAAGAFLPCTPPHACGKISTCRSTTSAPRSAAAAGGQSASAKDDYIEREGRYEGDASELEHSESGHMPGWAEEAPHAYWEAADAHERANGRLFREVEFALPVELDERSERRELAREFAQSLTRPTNGCPTPWRSTGAGGRTRTATW